MSPRVTEPVEKPVSSSRLPLPVSTEGGMDCPQCRAEDVIEIKHRLPDGTEVHFFSCHRCEEKWWDRDGTQIDLGQILEIVRNAER